MALAITCPGQGSQQVGMGRALAQAHPVAARVFAEVDDALGERLSELSWEGPFDTLTLTRNAQPALMAVSVAAMRVLEAEAGLDAGRAAFVAGHSLGEYSALVCAGALSLPDAARLLRLRGEAMQAAVPVGEGAMAVLLGLEIEEAVAVAAEAAAGGGVCDPANDNAPGQVVVSGDRAAVERAVEIAKGRGARRAMLLPVSAPFHCALMAPAAEAMARALEGVAMERPRVPLVANAMASAVAEPGEIKAALVRGVTGTVRWRESVAWMVGQGVTEIVEVGAGRVLTGLAKRIAPGVSASAVGTPEEAVAFAARLNAAAG